MSSRASPRLRIRRTGPPGPPIAVRSLSPSKALKERSSGLSGPTGPVGGRSQIRVQRLPVNRTGRARGRGSRSTARSHLPPRSVPSVVMDPASLSYSVARASPTGWISDIRPPTVLPRAWSFEPFSCRPDYRWLLPANQQPRRVSTALTQIVHSARHRPGFRSPRTSAPALLLWRLVLEGRSNS